MNSNTLRSSATYDFLIIGGGVIGLAIACEIKFRSPRASVAVFDKAQIGGQASMASVGMLEPQLIIHPKYAYGAEHSRSAFYEFCRAGQLMFKDWVDRLQDFTNIDIEYRSEGILEIYETRQEALKILEFYKGLDMRVDFLDETELRQVEPLLGAGYRALYAPDNHQVENRRLVAALIRACEIHGVDLFPVAAVQAIHFHDPVAEVVAGGLSYQSACCILAAGAWSSGFASLDGIVPKVKPMKGQILCLQTPHAGAVKHAAYHEGLYYVPRNDGRLLIGSTVEDVGFSADVDPSTMRSFRAFVEKLLPAAAWPAVDQWAGLRPATEDYYPVVGRTSMNALLVATGHFRNGILLAPITAKIIGDLAFDVDAAGYDSQFGTDRFDYLPADRQL